MSDAKAAEPSIEDILASIRKIISDDDETPAAAPVTETGSPHEPEPVAEIKPAAEAVDPWAEVGLGAEPAATEEDDDDDDVLELTEVVPEPEPTPAPAPVVKMPEPEDDEPIASAETVHAASDAFARLANPEIRHHLSKEMPVSSGGKSVEDLVREILRPMLREWIDGNLPEMVEFLVQKELRKISRLPEDL